MKILAFFFLACAILLMVACSDFYVSFKDHGSDYVAPTHADSLVRATDTIIAWNNSNPESAQFRLRFSIQDSCAPESLFLRIIANTTPPETVGTSLDTSLHQFEMTWTGDAPGYLALLDHVEIGDSAQTISTFLSFVSLDSLLLRASRWIPPHDSLTMEIATLAGDSLVGRSMGTSAFQAEIRTEGDSILWSYEEQSRFNLWTPQASLLRYVAQNVTSSNLFVTDTIIRIRNLIRK
jgi:hypothetical protein